MPPETAAQAEATSTLQAQGTATSALADGAASSGDASAGGSSRGAGHAGAAPASRQDITAAVQHH
jgi:hypothetical protein